MDDFLYIAACVVVPLLWGLLVVGVSNRIDHWVKSGETKVDQGNAMNPHDSTRIEYHI